MNKKVLMAIVAVVVVLLGCIGAATLDSCKRHADTKPCFGNSGK